MNKVHKSFLLPGHDFNVLLFVVPDTLVGVLVLKALADMLTKLIGILSVAVITTLTNAIAIRSLRIFPQQKTCQKSVKVAGHESAFCQKIVDLTMGYTDIGREPRIYHFCQLLFQNRNG